MHIFEEKGKEDRYKEGNHNGQYADLRPLGFELLFGNEGRVNDIEAEVLLNLRQGILLDLPGNQFVESVLEQWVRRLCQLLGKLRLLGGGLLQGLLAEG